MMSYTLLQMPEETWELTVEHPIWEERPTAEQERRARTRTRIPALTVLCHPDPSRVGEQARLSGLASGRAVLLSRAEPDFTVPGELRGRPLGDPYLSRSPIRFAASEEPGAVRLQIHESRTRVTADGLPVPGEQTFSARDMQRGIVLELSERIVLLLHTLPASAYTAPAYPGLIGDSETLLRVRTEIRRVSDLDVPVLIRGETGTGKELVARAIHQASRRRNADCLCVNMGAIPASLATSELFGAVKGSFTGSVRDQAGYFQKAHGGTLFLDEIGEAPPEVQVMLLRVLETGEIQRVGSAELQKVDVRLIAATDADLEKAIRDGRFRAPLLHRLSGYEMDLPPLRERREDFGRLLFFFLREELRAVGEEGRLDTPLGASPPWMPASVVARLARHPWPGNVRQLRNAARQIVIDSRNHATAQVGPQIERLLREVAQASSLSSDPQATPPPLHIPAERRRAEAADYRSPAEVGETELVDALRAHRWEIKAAAAQLGISRPSLYLLMEKYPSIRKAADLTRAEILECRELCGNDLDAMVDRLEVSKKGLLQRMKQLGIV